MTDRFVTRRSFARQLAAGTALAAGSWAATGDDDRPADDSPNPAPALPPPEPEDFLLGALLAQYPAEHLTPEMLAGIRADLGNHRRQAAQLRSVALDNSDEPATVFRAWREE